MPKDAWNKARRKKTGQRVMREYRDEERVRKDDYREQLEKPTVMEAMLDGLLNALEEPQDRTVNVRLLHINDFMKLVMEEFDRREMIQQLMGQTLQLAEQNELMRNYFQEPANCY